MSAVMKSIKPKPADKTRVKSVTKLEENYKLLSDSLTGRVTIDGKQKYCRWEITGCKTEAEFRDIIRTQVGGSPNNTLIELMDVGGDKEAVIILPNDTVFDKGAAKKGASDKSTSAPELYTIDPEIFSFKTKDGKVLCNLFIASEAINLCEPDAPTITPPIVRIFATKKELEASLEKMENFATPIDVPFVLKTSLSPTLATAVTANAVTAAATPAPSTSTSSASTSSTTAAAVVSPNAAAEPTTPGGSSILSYLNPFAYSWGLGSSTPKPTAAVTPTAAATTASAATTTTIPATPATTATPTTSPAAITPAKDASKDATPSLAQLAAGSTAASTSSATAAIASPTVSKPATVTATVAATVKPPVTESKPADKSKVVTNSAAASTVPAATATVTTPVTTAPPTSAADAVGRLKARRKK